MIKSTILGLVILWLGKLNMLTRYVIPIFLGLVAYGPILANAQDDQRAEIRELRNQVRALHDQALALQSKADMLIQHIEKLESGGIIQHEDRELKVDIPPQEKAQTPELKTTQIKNIPKTTTRTKIDFGGRVKLETVFNSPSVGSTVGGASPADTIFVASRIPLSGEGEKGQFSMTLRSSRLWMKTETPSDLGPVKTMLDIDFKGSTGNERVSNSHNPRLRNAYIDVAGFTLGQTTSTALDLATWPSALSDPVGNLFVRQPLMRYTWKLGKDTLQVALESPETTLMDSAGDVITPDDDRMPDLAMKHTWNRDWGHASISGLFRELRSDQANGLSDSALGGALFGHGLFKIADKDQLRLGIGVGNALGRYTSYNSFTGGSLDDSGQIHLHPMAGGYISYLHWWEKNWRSGFVVSGVYSDNDTSVVPDTAPKWASSYHVNLGVDPTEKLYVGLNTLVVYLD